MSVCSADAAVPGDGGAVPGVVDVVVPRGIADAAHPSGGNVYDRHVILGLRAAGWAVREHRVSGPWPHPGACDRRALAFALTPQAARRAARGGTAAGATVPRTGADLPPAPALVDGMLAAATGDIVRHAARLRPVVVLSHMLFGAVDPALRSPERTALTAAQTVVAVSEAAAAELRAAYDLPDGHVRVVHPGTASAAAAVPSPHGRRLVCVAAVSPAKGHDTLVEALVRLPRATDWTCTCVGLLDVDAGFTATLRARVAAAGLADRVRFTGPREAADVDAAYAAADVVVLPSRGETWGLAVTEALARGIPVIASAVGGVIEAVGGTDDDVGDTVPGLLVPPGDTDALCAALTRWLGDPALRERLRTAAAARARALPRWDATARGVADALTDAQRSWSRVNRHAPGGSERPLDAVAAHGV